MDLTIRKMQILLRKYYSNGKQNYIKWRHFWKYFIQANRKSEKERRKKKN